jgi:hypothetical protein
MWKNSYKKEPFMQAQNNKGMMERSNTVKQRIKETQMVRCIYFKNIFGITYSYKSHLGIKKEISK